MDLSNITLSQAVNEDATESDHEAVVAQPDENSSASSQETMTVNPSGQYALMTETDENGEMSYRVVQMGEDGQPQIIATPTSQPTVIQTADGLQVLNTGTFQSQTSELASVDHSMLSQVTHLPTAAPPTAPQPMDSSFATTIQQSAGNVVTVQPQLSNTAVGQGADGQYYVMMSPQDVLQPGGGAAPKVIQPNMFASGATSMSPQRDGGNAMRDDRRKSSHKEVERRRRDKMNTWIVQLSKMVPSCTDDGTGKAGGDKSKAAILSKACEYISELRLANSEMAESVKNVEQVFTDSELLKAQVEDLKQENALLQSTLLQHGIIVQTETANTGEGAGEQV